MKGHKISTKEDFPNITIWEENTPNGRTHRITFDNLELFPRKHLWIYWVILALAVAFGYPAYYIPFPTAEHTTLIVIWPGLVIGIYYLMKKPEQRKRTIELDWGAHELRVLGGKSVSITQTLRSEGFLTVEPPDDPDPRVKTEKGQSEECLYGYFDGADGYKTLIVKRFDKGGRINPKRPKLTLSEVLDAIIWIFVRENFRMGTK